MGISTVTRSVALATTGLVAVGVVASPIAQAYPPGNKIEVYTNKVVYKAGQKVKIRTTQLQPGCNVQVKIEGYGYQKKKVYRDTGRSINTKMKGPKEPGRYKVYVKNFGKGCLTASSKSNFRIKKGSNALG